MDKTQHLTRWVAVLRKRESESTEKLEWEWQFKTGKRARSEHELQSGVKKFSMPALD